MHIELRSDTFTKPTPEMLQAIMQAPVGDDVFGECPTTNLLEKTTAELFGYEAALFCVSGTMANQIAIKAHTQPGDEVICDALSHIYLYEGGGIASNSLASVHLLHGDRGMITADMVANAIHEDNVHYPKSKLVCLENTVNKGGGACYNLEAIIGIKNTCVQNNLALHLDGARIWNAIVATNTKAIDYGKLFDTISVCLSKGLGTPMGSILLGNASFIHNCKRIRKRMGGGWRQSGYMAAAGIYALQNNIQRLAQDHALAMQLGDAFSSLPFVQNVLPVETNIVIANLPTTLLAQQVVEAFAAKNIFISPFGKHAIRLVTHMQFTIEDAMEVQKVASQISF